VLVVDADRVIVMANPAAHVLLLSVAESPADPAVRRAHDGSDLEGRSFVEAARHADFERILGKTLASHEPASGEVAVDRPRPRRLLVHAAPLAGAPHGAVVVLVDVTEIRRLESIRKDFVANVSHELRTPLTAVRTAIETARSALRQDPQEADRFLEIADRHSERLTALVRDLLDLSRIESGHLTLRPAPTAAEDVAAEVITLFREPAGRRKLRLAADFAADLPPAWVDREALMQVLTNLVENAVKYTDEGGVVTLRGRSAGDKVRISVEDSGPGISPKHAPRIFERFYRVDAGRSRDRGGTGLGLSIVKHLVEAMHGTVTLDSELGRGSSFCVLLPTAAPANMAGSPAATARA
jgi:two-component system phosphate regulon sensor histidine kinase PhoR